MRIFCLLIFITSFSSVMGQGKFDKIYKKARAYANVKPDSAIYFVNKCLKVANTREKRYKSYYLLGYCANRMKSYGLAVKSYKFALSNADDGLRANITKNSLAAAYLNAQEVARATQLNQEAVIALEQQGKKEGVREALAYALGIKGRLFVCVEDRAALGVLKNAVGMAEPEARASIHKELANAFFTFNMPDSAIHYQKKVLETYKSKIKLPLQYIKMARYQLQAGNVDSAKVYLKMFQDKFQKTRTTDVLEKMNVEAMIYLKQGNQRAAIAKYQRCAIIADSLKQSIEDPIDKKAISMQIQEMYDQVLKMPNLDATAYCEFAGHRKANSVEIELYAQKIAFRDSLQVRDIFAPATAGVSGNILSARPDKYTLYLLGLLLVMVFVLVLFRGRLHPAEPPAPAPWELALIRAEERLRGEMSRELLREEKKILKEMYKRRDLNYTQALTEVAELMGMNTNSLKTKLQRLSKKANARNAFDLLL